MKNKSLFLLAIIVLVSLACQTLTKTTGPENIPTAIPIAQSQPDIKSIFNGLIYESYRDEKYQIWQIGEDSLPRLLLPNHYWGTLSPDKKKLVYYDDLSNGNDLNCAWYADFEKKEIKPLDCSRGEFSHASILDWEKENPASLLAYLNVVPGIGGFSAYLGTINVNDGEKKIFDTKYTSSSVSISPDGETIAYVRDSNNDFYQPLGWFYSSDSELNPFILKEYGETNYAYVDYPAWSPNGSKIAWGLLEDHDKAAIGIFDTAKKTSIVVHPHILCTAWDTYATPPEVVWNPDGNFFAANICVRGEQIGQVNDIKSGLWIFSADGKTSYQIEGWFLNWSPDGQWLFSTDYDAWEDLRVSHIDGTETTILGKIKIPTNGLAWSKDGRYFAFSDDKGKIQVVEVGTWKIETASNIENASNVIGWEEPIPDIMGSMVIPAPKPPPAFDCPNAPRTRVQVGDTARTTYKDGTPTRLRSKPEVNGNVVDNLPEGTEFKIIDGPVCTPRPSRKDSFVYWQVTIPSRKVEGWIAEGDLDNYYIEPWP